MNSEKDPLLLFHRIAKGDKEAFDIFFNRYYPKLVRFAQIYVHSTPLAEDVVADVLVNLLQQRQRIFMLTHFEAYLYTSVKNKALTAQKKESRLCTPPQDYQDPNQQTGWSTTPYQLLVDHELHVLTRDIIQNLPPKRKLVFSLIRDEGLSYRQVAQQMNISERTVEVHLRLAVKTLRQAIASYLDKSENKNSLVNVVKLLALLLLIGLSSGV